MRVKDIDREKLVNYLQYKFPLSKYTMNNLSIHDTWTGSDNILVINSDGTK